MFADVFLEFYHFFDFNLPFTYFALAFARPLSCVGSFVNSMDATDLASKDVPLICRTRHFL
jgi:hypothetical protein